MFGTVHGAMFGSLLCVWHRSGRDGWELTLCLAPFMRTAAVVVGLVTGSGMLTAPAAAAAAVEYS